MKTAIRTICLAAAALIAVSCGVSRPAAQSQQQPIPQPQNQPDPQPQSTEAVVPAFLQKGDKIAILAPAYTTPFENVLGAAEVIRSWGYEPVIGSKVQKLYAGKYAGTDGERASDLRWALEDPEIKAIICTRGGYGTIRLIDRFKPEEFAANPKWLVGYSDITTLIEMENCAGVAAIHGTMGNTIAKDGEDATCQTLKSLLEGTVPQYELSAHPQNRLGKATGILVGGNICTFAANLDTWADATSKDDIILFVEEVEESMHHIDRLFNMLLMRGLLQRCKGIIFGEFTGCGSEFDFGSIEAMLNTYLKGYDIPVLCGFPAGHGEVNLPLVMGVPVTIDVRSEGATVSFGINGIKSIVSLR
jgi:muramoyltetrapeptide carboxypeptidase